MCSICQEIPLVLDKKLILSDFRYKLLAIRHLDDKWFFTLEHFAIVQPGDRYWGTPGMHFCGSCLRRNIEDKSIHWLPHDYDSHPAINVIDVGNQLLDRALRLRAFL